MTKNTVVVLACGLVTLASCGAEDEFTLDREELLKPESCKKCHPKHYEEWAGSMHAYAADSPTFIAELKDSLEGSKGVVGGLCVTCHAPMALREGATEDGLNLAELPQHLKRVTCYFCHSVETIEDDHNNQMTLATDLVMRGGVADPKRTHAHGQKYSAFHDRNQPKSSLLCGSCHDAVNPVTKGILESTYQEWLESVFATENPAGRLSCSGCHMRSKKGAIADGEGMPIRRLHSHAMPGVDTALIPWPGKEAQKALVTSSLSSSLVSELCVKTDAGRTTATVTLENLAAGHNFPSGVAYKRRVWVELIAYDGDAVLHSSGAIKEGEGVHENKDPDLWQIRDYLLDSDGKVVSRLWQGASRRSDALPAHSAASPLDPKYRDTHVKRDYTFAGSPSRVTLRVMMRSKSLQFMDEMIAKGYLDARLRDVIPTYALGSATLEWKDSLGRACIPEGFK